VKGTPIIPTRLHECFLLGTFSCGRMLELLFNYQLNIRYLLIELMVSTRYLLRSGVEISGKANDLALITRRGCA
jgi:hypothetical protein